METNNENKKNNNKWLSLINIPIQMGVIIFLFSYLGNW
ncbi:MAG: F0F1-ATPase subunit, partial [Flavobacterium sp.]